MQVGQKLTFFNGEKMTSAPQQVREALMPLLEEQGLHLVLLQITGSQRPRLQILIERKDGTGVTLDECARVSRLLSPHLDVIGPFQTPYVLEVSSPGIDRPLVCPEDFYRFVGKKITCETHDPIEGRKRFKGHLDAAEGQTITLTCEDPQTTLVLNFAQIHRAKLDPEFNFKPRREPQ
jgi:ribosome maturation factor RimP